MWDEINNRCALKNSDILIHNHNSHDHPRAHTCASSYSSYYADYINTCGSSTQGNQLPLASRLINEFLFNEDMDGNGKVYGYDFKISNSDTNKPPVLTAIESNPDWTDPTCSITWQQYKDWETYGNDSTADPWISGLC